MTCPFTVLGLEPAFELSPRHLEKAWIEAQKRWHPDRFVTASLEEKNLAAWNTAALNEALRVLQHPVHRAEALCVLAGWVQPGQTTEQTSVRTSLAEHIFLWHERLEEAWHDMHSLQRLCTGARAALDQATADFAAAWKVLPRQKETCLLALETMAFLDKTVAACTGRAHALEDCGADMAQTSC
jgi:DnaJ-domain-containing protein 1